MVKLNGVGEGWSVAISADGNTAAMGGPNDNGGLGAVWIFTRSGGAWSQQGSKLVGAGADGGISGQVRQGTSIGLSADGNTLLFGGPYDNVGGPTGAAWVFTRNGNTWTQQGGLLAGSGWAASPYGVQQGSAVALSGDGNTALIAGPYDSPSGAVWTFTRSNGVWTQQGTKLTGVSGGLALSSDGSTALIGTSVFTRNNGVQGAPWTLQATLTGSGAAGSAYQGSAVALSADGNTALVGDWGDDNDFGSARVFTRSGGAWTQQGAKLAVPHPFSQQFPPGTGYSVALSEDGNTAVLGAPADNDIEIVPIGGAWVFTRAGGVWSQLGLELVGEGEMLPPHTGISDFGSGQGWSAAVSGDGSTVISGSHTDNNDIGAAWIFARPAPSASVPAGVSPGAGSGLSQEMTFTFTDARGWQDLDVVDILIDNFLDGREACYLAYSRTAGVLYLVNDAGTELLPALAPGSQGSTANSQCTVNGTGWSVAGNANTLTLTLDLTFAYNFAGNKVIFMAARDLEGGNSGWQPLGSWNVPGAVTFPAVIGVSPASGAGSSQAFTFTFSDTKGAQDLGILDILINTSLDGLEAA